MSDRIPDSSAGLLAMIEKGSIISLPTMGGGKLLPAPYARFDGDRLVIYCLVSDRARTIRFERIEWPHHLGAWFIQDGQKFAYLTSVAEADEDSRAAWRSLWLDQPADEKQRLNDYFVEAVDGMLQ